MRIYGSDGIEKLSRSLVDPVTGDAVSVTMLDIGVYGLRTRDEDTRKLLEGILLTLQELVNATKANATYAAGDTENMEGVA